ncbi:unnamed protein product, partial [Closterium sp. NIES-54]
MCVYFLIRCHVCILSYQPCALHRDLSSNNLSGSLPSALGVLSNLFTLSVNDNQLTGKLPPSICNLTQMHTMFLHNNRFYGEFPPCLYQHCLHR